MIAVALHDLTDKPEFGNGLAWALLVTPIAVCIAIIWRSAWNRPAPVAGLAATAAFAGAMHFASDPPSNLVWGLVLLAAAGAAIDLLALLWAPLLLVGAGLAWPGASLLTIHTGVPTPHWVGTLVVQTERSRATLRRGTRVR